ncbi:MAG: methyltransferase domain-containing protein [Acidimicrobiia bacterium]|nr:methyltransferase domain-containing protein [Acidimicrobiia bacterium]
MAPTDHEGRTIDFGRTADDYDAHRPGFPPRFFDTVVRRGWIPDGGTALDLGSGTGSLALGWARRGLAVTALDIAPELLEVAVARADAEGLRVATTVAPAERTGQPDDAFDLVTAGQCWWWFDSDAATAEAQRVLRPGGRLLICNFSYLPLPGSAAARTESLVLDHNPGWPKAGWRGVHPEQVRALDIAGFEKVESFSFTTDVSFTHEAWRGRMRTCNGVGSALAPDAVDRFDTDLATLLGREFGDPLVITHRVFAVSGVVA